MWLTDYKSTKEYITADYILAFWLFYIDLPEYVDFQLLNELHVLNLVLINIFDKTCAIILFYLINNTVTMVTTYNGISL